jgi:hypothetical protein
MQMAKEADGYPYRGKWSEENVEYGGLCAELPSLSWLEESPEKALPGIRKLVKDTLVDMQQSRKPIPQPIRRVPTAASSWCGFLLKPAGCWQSKQQNPGENLNRPLSRKLS